MPVAQNLLLTAEIAVKGTIVSKGSTAVKTVNIFHYRRIASAVDTTTQNIANGLDGTVGIAMAAAMNLGWTLDTVEARWLEDPTSPYYVKSPARSGAITGDRFPPHIAAYLFFRSNLRGRNYKGSKHLGPMSESDTSAATADIWNAGAFGRLQDIASAVLAGWTDGTPNTFVPVIVSKKLSNFGVTPCNIVSADVTSILVNQRAGSMLRRKVKTLY